MKRKLYRNLDNKIVAGVCSGLADFLHIKPFIIRILWAAVFLIFGLGLGLYLICAMIIPARPGSGQFKYDSTDFNEVDEN